MSILIQYPLVAIINLIRRLFLCSAHEEWTFVSDLHISFEVVLLCDANQLVSQ